MGGHKHGKDRLSLSSRKIKSTVQSLIRELKQDIKTCPELGVITEFLDATRHGIMRIDVAMVDGEIKVFKNIVGSKKGRRRLDRH